MPASDQQKAAFLSRLQELADPKAPSLIYYLTLFHIFKDLGDELDEERIIKSATGIRNTTVWKKLYKFQRDGVLGAIDKLERLGGCIIADSVGLGKTFEALAIIKYYELRNDRVLVLVPKRLRDNWTLYKANDRRNFLASDRFNYDVLNHTDLSRDGGTSGDIDLAHVNWGNYDLVVIDESHNFRNKATHNDRETRYDRLMRRIIKEGVKTRVLMLSATPVNNRLADLKNQIAFVTEANDTALDDHGIPSIEATVRQAQLQFNRWMTLEDRERRPARLLEMLGFDYFKLLDLLTIARSRKHIEKYYGTKETGRFPERLKPINIKREVDLAGEFRSIREINNEIRRLTPRGLRAALRYVLPHKQAAYDAKYSTKIRGGESFFRQVDREESLVHLLRVNVLKRMESSVTSFALTFSGSSPTWRPPWPRSKPRRRPSKKLTSRTWTPKTRLSRACWSGARSRCCSRTWTASAGGRTSSKTATGWPRCSRRQSRWTRRGTPSSRPSARSSSRNAAQPINPGNRKLLVFTAFADTAQYLYKELAGLGTEGTRPARGPCHRRRPQPDDAAQPPQGLRQHHHGILAPLEGTSRRPRRAKAKSTCSSPRTASARARTSRTATRSSTTTSTGTLSASSSASAASTVSARPTSASSSSTSGPTWSWRSTSTSNSASAAGWCSWTFPPRAKRTSSSTSPATR